MADLRAVVLQHEYPESEALLPQALARIARFCVRYDSDSTGSHMMQVCLANYLAPEPALKVLVVLRGDDIVGHLVASVEEWCGRRYCTLAQAEADVALPRALMRDILEQVESWARGQGATILRVLSRVDKRGAARGRAFRMLYGFKATRLIMDRKIGGG